MEGLDAPRPLGVAFAELRAAGYTISPDRFSRFRLFGISSHRLGGELKRWISAACLERLTFILEVERRFGFERDREGLALELAFAGYPVVPWDHVHAAACKRPARFIKRLNVQLHQINGTSGTEFNDQELQRAANNVAYRYIPKDAVKASAQDRFTHQIVSAALLILFRVSFLHQDFSEREIRKILAVLGLPIEQADELAHQTATLLNSGGAPQLLFLDDENTSVQALLTPSIDERVWRETIDRAKILSTMYLALAGLVTPNPNLGLGISFPDVTSIPVKEKSDLRYHHGLRAALTCVAFTLRGNTTALEMTEKLRNGMPAEVQTIIDNLALLKIQIPAIVRARYAS